MKSASIAQNAVEVGKNSTSVRTSKRKSSTVSGATTQGRGVDERLSLALNQLSKQAVWKKSCQGIQSYVLLMKNLDAISNLVGWTLKERDNFFGGSVIRESTWVELSSLYLRIKKLCISSPDLSKMVALKKSLLKKRKTGCHGKR